MWTKSACVVLAWSILLIVLVAICRQGSVRQAQANIRIASSAQVTLTSTVDAVSTSARATGPARKYVVQQGDTLSGIAAALAMRGGWPALYAADRRVIGPDPDVIRPGTVLTVPGPAAAAAPRPAPPASKPSAHGHPARPSRPRPVRTTAAAAGMPQGLKILLLAAGLVIGLVFLVELMLVARRQHEIRLRTPGPDSSPRTRPASSWSTTTGSS